MRENADQKTPNMDFSRSENYIIFQKKKKNQINDLVATVTVLYLVF